MHAGCSPFMLNCSQPDAPSLLEALKPVFNLKSIRPVMNVSTPTTVNIFIILFGILGVDEKAQILTTFIWQQLDWRNEFILWDPEQCGSQWITIPRKLLWVPDVVINEFMEKNSAPFAPYNCVYFNGSVVDAQPVRVISSCRLDIYLFPFDVQNCSLSFNSYLYRKIRGFVLHVLGRLVQLPPKSRDLQDVTVLRNPAAYEMKVTHPVEGYVEAPEQNGPLNETKALEELRSLGKELQALRLQVEQQQLGGNQSAEEWVQVGLIIDRLLCGIYILFISVSFITIIAIWAQSYNTV